MPLQSPAYLLQQSTDPEYSSRQTLFSWMSIICYYFLPCCLLFVSTSSPAATLSADLDMEYPSYQVKAPTFSAPDLQGNNVSMPSAAYRIQLIHFWATFCPPCIKELPGLQALQQKYATAGLGIITIAVDRHNRGAILNMVEQLSLTLPVLLDPEGKIRKQYEIFALPTTYVLDQSGFILGRIVGSRDWQATPVQGRIEQLLQTTLKADRP